MRYKVLEQGDSKVCENILRQLPQWFGIEESTQAYILKSKELPMVVAIDDEGEAVGFVSLKRHSDFTYEVYVMGVLTNSHRKGIGKGLLQKVQSYLSTLGTEFLQVKTVSSERECEFYKKTRLFYKSMGFREVEIFPTLWDESNPCLLMIKTV